MINQRDAAVSGLFYPSDPDTLKSEVSRFLALSSSNSGTMGVKFLIVPHAGYIYSGQIAADCFSEINIKRTKRVILLGPSHHHYFKGLVASNYSFWKTPLGSISVETNRINFIKTESEFHKKEHCLEVQIPFLKYLLPDAVYLPLLTSGPLSQAVGIAKKLHTLDSSSTLWVISSDFCHVGPRFGYDTKEFGFDSGEDLDKKAIKLIESGDTDKFISFLESTRATICGALPILIGMHLRKALECPQFSLKSYSSSGRQTGDINSVGYAAICC